MLEGAGAAFDPSAVLAGQLTPEFFGSAMNNFGVELLLNSFLRYSPPPAARMSQTGPVTPETPAFSAFIFKIQANMDPKHRDRLAFVRVVSGTFRRDMTVFHVPTGRTVRLSNAQSLFGRERETVDEAHPGDVVGLVGGRDFGIGDTLSEDPSIAYREIPRFPPECFALLHNPDASQYKRFNQGVEQLLQEGVVQAFYVPRAQQKALVLGAVGTLQFEIVQHRLLSEYRAKSRLEHAAWTTALWVTSPGVAAADLHLPEGVAQAEDGQGNAVVFFADQWQEKFFRNRNPAVGLSSRPHMSVETRAVTAAHEAR